MKILGLDAWQDRGWAGDDLRSLARELSARFEGARRETERALLARHQRQSLEPWMEPLLDREAAADPLQRVLARILPLVRRTVEDQGTLLYLID